MTCTEIFDIMTTGAGVLVLGHGHISHIVKMHYFFKNLLLNSQAQIRQTKYVVMITKEGSTKIVNFMTPGAVVLVLGRGCISHIVKLHYFQAQIKQTKCIVMMTKEGCTKIVKFIQVIIVNIIFFFSINILHIDCYCVKG